MSLLRWSVQPNVSQGKKRKLLVLESAEERDSKPKMESDDVECFRLQSVHDTTPAFSTEDLSDADIPDCWTLEQVLTFCQKNTWLCVKNKKLGCSTCMALKRTNQRPKSQGSRFSEEWTQCTVTSYGSDKSRQQQSLRKKIREHKESNSHKTAVEFEKETSEDSVFADEEKTMCRMLHAVYNIGKERRPFVDITVDLDAEQMNRIKMGQGLKTEPCVDIIDHIASDVRKRLVMDIVENQFSAPQRDSEVEHSNLQSGAMHKFAPRTSADEMLDADIPECWSIEQMLKYYQKNTWLVVKNKKLGCLPCTSLKSVATEKSQSTRFSLEWAKCAVTASGDNKKKQQLSLCKKIGDHKESNMHKTAVQVEKEMLRWSKLVGEEETTFRVFRTIYNIGEEGYPLVDMRVDLNVQQMKMLEMAQSLQTGKSCVDVIDQIASDVRESLVKGIVENKYSAPQSDKDVEERSNFQSRTVLDVATSALTEGLLYTDLPDCWSVEQMQSFCQKNTWLVVKNKKLGCSACKALKFSETGKFLGIRVAAEWIEGCVTCYGIDKIKQQQSLRKKIREHRESNAHKNAMQVGGNTVQDSTPVAEEETACRVSCTVFNIGEEGLPLFDLMADLDVQQTNELKSAQGRLMDRSCVEVIDHVAPDMSKEHVKDILENAALVPQSDDGRGCPRLVKDIPENAFPDPQSDGDVEGGPRLVKDIPENASPDPQSDGDVEGGPRLVKDIPENASPDPQSDGDVEAGPRLVKGIPENASPDPQSDGDVEAGPRLVKGIPENASPDPQSGCDVEGGPRLVKDIPENASPDPQSDGDVEGGPRLVKGIPENASPDPQSDCDVEGGPRLFKDIPENASPDPQSDDDVEGGPRLVKDIPENASPDPQSDGDVEGCPRHVKDIPENIIPENVSPDPQSDGDVEGCPRFAKLIPENTSSDPQSDSNIEGCPRFAKLILQNTSVPQNNGGVRARSSLQSWTMHETPPSPSTEEMCDADIPDCWSIEQMLMFCKKNTWLIIKNKKLTCSACKALKSMETRKHLASRVSVEWTYYGVICYGNDKMKQQQSLRKKIFEHRDSNSHKTAMQVKKEASHGCKPVGEKERTWRVFRSVYNIGKRGYPFVDAPADVQMSGIKKARVLDNEPCVDIEYIASDVSKGLNISSVPQRESDVEACSSLHRKTMQAIDQADIPECWTIEQTQRFCQEYTWLVIQKKKMGCSACKALRSSETHKSIGSRVTVEWAECGMTCYGKDRTKQQQSLRKKIREHKESLTHKTAMQVQKEISQGCAPVGEEETTCRVFRTVYSIGKHGRPLVDMTADINVQQMNGLKMGRVLHTGKSCADVIDHIASDMRKRLVQDIVENKRKLCLLLDDTTTFTGKSVIVLCLRAAVGEESSVQTFFFDLLELDGTTAADVVAAVVECLHRHGLHDEFLQQCLIAVSCDGASDKLGRHVGVAAQLQDRYPGIFVWHCSNHRLELAVGEVIKKNSGLDYFKIFFDKLYSLYNYSPEIQWELGLYASEVEQCLRDIGHRFSIEYVASSEKCVKAVWQSYDALHQFFSTVALELFRDSRLRTKMAYLDKMLTSSALVKNMGVICDALVELSDFSRQVDNPDLTLPDADELLATTISVLESMAHTPFPYTEEANQSCQNLCFESIDLRDHGKPPVVQSGEFFRSLSENLKARLATRESLHDGTNGPLRAQSSKIFIEQVKLLYPENWPENVTADKGFGDDGVRKLCQTLQVNVEDSVRGFQEYKECKATNIPADLKPLLTAVQTIAVSTSECHRSLRCMNDLMTAKRNSLAIPRLSSLLFLKCVGPPVACFEPLPYVKTWLGQGRRSADEVACRKIKQEAETSPSKSLWKLF